MQEGRKEDQTVVNMWVDLAKDLTFIKDKK